MKKTIPAYASRTLLAAANVAMMATLLAGCGSHSGGAADPGTPVSQSTPNSPFVSKAIAKISVSTADQSGDLSILATSGTIPIQITNAPNTAITIDATGFKIPTIGNSVLNFGAIRVSGLIDNNLMVCGTDGTSACTTAVIRIYTMGTPGAGIYNTAGGYGMPINAKLSSNSAQNVGLAVAGAAVMQTVTIPLTKHSVLLSDFTPSPVYGITSDFTNAGAGTYATTLWIEYGLQ